MVINIDFSSSVWVEELLRRSEPKPLIIQSSPVITCPGIARTEKGPNSYSMPKWQAVLKEIHRIRVLHLTFAMNYNLAPLTKYFQPAPLLESLYMCHGAMAHPSFQWLNGGSLFASTALKLREIILKSVPDTTRFIRTSELALVNLDISDRTLCGDISIMQWLVVLSGQPKLEYLTIEINTITELPEDDAILYQVPLPHLRKLHLRSSDPIYDIIFPCLDIPSFCVISLEVVADKFWNIAQSDDIAASIESYLQTQTILPLATHWCIYFQHTAFTLLAFVDQVLETEPILSISYKPEHIEGSFVFDILKALKSTGAMKEASMLTLMSIARLYDEFEEALSSLLPTLHNIRTLQLIEKSTIEDILLPLLQRSTTGTLSNQAVLLPNLTSVIYKGLFECDDMWTTSPEGEAMEAANHLLDFFEYRGGAGKRIPNLIVAFGSLERNEARALTKQVFRHNHSNKVSALNLSFSYDDFIPLLRAV